MRCTAKYTNCTRQALRGGYCQSCINMEVDYHRRRRIELKIDLENTEKQLERLGAPVKKFALAYSSKSPISVPTDGDGSFDDFPKNGLYCSICKKPQYETPSGATCEEEHGGADGIEL